jgi:hypothetical protein
MYLNKSEASLPGTREQIPDPPWSQLLRCRYYHFATESPVALIASKAARQVADDVPSDCADQWEGFSHSIGHGPVHSGIGPTIDRNQGWIDFSEQIGSTSFEKLWIQGSL